jgi:hypothetical protein
VSSNLISFQHTQSNNYVVATTNSILGLTNAKSVGRALSPGKTETAIEIYGFMVNK